MPCWPLFHVCRGKNGVDLEYVLGCGIASTPEQRSRFVEVLTSAGKHLVFIDCSRIFNTDRLSALLPLFSIVIVDGNLFD